MNRTSPKQRGYTLLELLVAMSIGLILIGAVIVIYSVQSQVYKSTNAQASIQDAENAIAALVTPSVRSAGFEGCSTVTTAVSNLNVGGPAPVGSLSVSPTIVAGYDFQNTAGPGTSLIIAADNAPNDSAASHWNPSLEPTLVGYVAPGSDVLVVLSAAAGSKPVGVTASVKGGTSVTVADASEFMAGDLVAVSDCLKSSVFRLTSIAGNDLVHAVGIGALTNATAALSLNYPVGSQAVPLRETAFFVSSGANGTNVLSRATLAGTSWNVEQLVPGVETMQVLYGIGAANDGLVTRYVAAGAVTDWTLVYSVRLAFLIEGRVPAGASPPASAPDVLGTAVTPPSDGMLRHVYEMTINLRNSAP